MRDGTQVIVDRGFEDIDFRSGPAHVRAVTVLRSRVFLTGTGATREPLARKVGKVTQVVLIAWVLGNIRYALPSLVGDGTDIARVVGVRPLYRSVD